MARKAILADVLELGLDPTRHHTNVGSSGRIKPKKEEAPKKSEVDVDVDGTDDGSQSDEATAQLSIANVKLSNTVASSTSVLDNTETDPANMVPETVAMATVSKVPKEESDPKSKKKKRSSKKVEN